MRQELEKYDYLRSVSQPINEFIAKIEKELDRYELKLLKSEKVKYKRGDPEEIMPVDADLVEKIDEIIRSYDISYDWCPRFF